MTYIATEHSTVKDKEKFARQFKKFVESDYDLARFPNWFYKRLSMCFGHMAHYDRRGFFFTQFGYAHSIKGWEKRIMYWKTFGDPENTYSDVERDLSNWLGELRGVTVNDSERMVILG